MVAAWGRARTVRTSALVAMAGGLLVVLGPTVGAVLARFAALGVGLACTVPVAFSAAADGAREAGPALAAVTTPGTSGSCWARR